MPARHFPARALSRACVAAALAACVTMGAPLAAAPAYTLFESGQVRPLALSPNGQLLFAVNTPDSRLEIFRVITIVRPNGVFLRHLNTHKEPPP